MPAIPADVHREPGVEPVIFSDPQHRCPNTCIRSSVQQVKRSTIGPPRVILRLAQPGRNKLAAFAKHGMRGWPKVKIPDSSQGSHP
jgi:hypothetical protein